MWALVQAREKLSHCSVCGNFQGLKMMSGSVLKEVMIIQRKGKMTKIAQSTSRNWAVPAKAQSPNPIRTAIRCERLRRSGICWIASALMDGAFRRVVSCQLSVVREEGAVLATGNWQLR